jgi:hypothetical protein
VSDVQDHILDIVTPYVTLERAQQIRGWRCSEPMATWRKVAELAYEAWGKPEWLSSGHQLYGIALCEASAKLLGEDAYQDPWN